MRSETHKKKSNMDILWECNSIHSYLSQLIVEVVLAIIIIIIIIRLSMMMIDAVIIKLNSYTRFIFNNIHKRKRFVRISARTEKMNEDVQYKSPEKINKNKYGYIYIFSYFTQIWSFEFIYREREKNKQKW